MFGNHSCPRVAQITIAAIVTQNEFRSRFDMFAFRFKDTGANAEGLMPVAINQENAFVR